MQTTFGLITAPALEPVSIAEAKAHLRLEDDTDDAAVEANITAARIYAEEYCWRGFVTQVWEFVSSCFPETYGSKPYLELPRGNLVAVESVKYIDTNGVQQTLDPSVYSLDLLSVPGRVRLAFDESWPDHRSQWDAVRVRYTVGWAVGAVPQPIKNAVLLAVADLYENRLPNPFEGNTTVQALVRPYRLARF